MGVVKLQRTEMVAQDGTPIRLVYDEEADILEIFFGENGPATGLELTSSIVLRLDRKAKRILSVMLRHFSILAEQTEYGPRSFPLEKLESLPAEIRELVLRLLTTLPVSQFLKLSHLQASPKKNLPLAYVEAQPMIAYA
jgi:hypothetical protein